MAEAPKRQGAPPAARLVIVAQALSAVALAVAEWAVNGPPRDPTVFAVMAVVFIAAYVGPRRRVAGSTGFNVGGLTILATIPLAGGLTASAVGLLSVLATWGRVPARARAFNAANLVAIACSGGLAYSLTAGERVGDRPLTDVGHLGLGLVVAAVVIVAVNAGFVAAVMSTSEGTRYWTTLRELVFRMGSSYLTFAVVALLVDVLWKTVGLGPFAVVLGAPFIWGVRWTTGQFADQIRTHEWVIRAVQAALDERFPGARRRSERTARWAGAIAEEAGLPVRTILRAQTAGALAEIDRLNLPGHGAEGAMGALAGLSFTSALTGPDPDPMLRRLAVLAAQTVTHLDDGTPLPESRLGASPSGLRIASARDRALSRAAIIDGEVGR